MGAGAAPMQSAEQSVKRSRRIQKYSLLLKTPAHANTHHTPRRAFRGPEAATEGTGGQSRCREDSGAVSRKSLSGGPEAATEGTGGQSRCREDRGARAAAGRTGGKRRSWNGGRSRAHAVSRAVSETKQTNTKVLTLIEDTCPRKHTPHTPEGLSGAGSRNRGNRGPEPLPGGLGGRKPQEPFGGAGSRNRGNRGAGATAGRVGGRSRSREQQVSRPYHAARSLGAGTRSLPLGWTRCRVDGTSGRRRSAAPDARPRSPAPRRGCTLG